MYTYIGSNSMHYWISIISKYNFLIYQLLQIMWLMLIFQGLVGHCDRKHFFCSKLPLCFYRFIQALGLLLFTHFCLGWNIRRNNGPSFFLSSQRPLDPTFLADITIWQLYLTLNLEKNHNFKVCSLISLKLVFCCGKLLNIAFTYVEIKMLTLL